MSGNRFYLCDIVPNSNETRDHPIIEENSYKCMSCKLGQLKEVGPNVVFNEGWRAGQPLLAT